MKRLIVNGRIFFPNGEIGEGQILIDGRMIAEVGREIPPPADAEILDASDCTVIPGLIDAHLHITFGPDYHLLPPGQVALRAASKAHKVLMAGTTAIRDVGGLHYLDIALRDAIDGGELSGPHMLASGRFIAITGGHAYVRAREADGCDDIRKAVREQVKAGADFLKFMASGGVADSSDNPQSAQLTLDELKVGVEEATRAGRKAIAHAHSLAAIKNAIDAGCYSIEHGTYMDDETARRAAGEGVWLVPTFDVYREIAESGKRPAKLAATAKAVLEAKVPRFLRALELGVRWGIGTDGGTSYPVDNLAAEMEFLVRLGIRNNEVLLRATKVNAEILGLDRKTGTIESGKQADLVIVEGNPVTDIRSLKRIRWVIKDGKKFSPSET